MGWLSHFDMNVGTKMLEMHCLPDSICLEYTDMTFSDKIDRKCNGIILAPKIFRASKYIQFTD